MSDHFDENPVDAEYASLHNDVEILNDQLAAVSSEIRNQDISKYPIFVASQDHVNVGKPLFTKEDNLINWNINMSTLENLVNLKIISLDKVDEFRKVYKDPDQFYCFLVMKSDSPEFIFIKKPKAIKSL